jgi:hypothetical protein
MAAAEAKALLDQLMGGDRDLPLPPGAALPRKRGQGEGESGDALLLPGKRHKSCYDNDICPLYCAWGVDVYDLFVNTKSDIGPNPNTSDDAARKEYAALPQHEKERLGFDHFLFNKLGELVHQCDRTIMRNNEKLRKELERTLQKRGGQDYVIDVDEVAVENLCRSRIMAEELIAETEEALAKLGQVKEKEDDLSKQLEAQAKVKKDKEKAGKVKEESKTEEGSVPIESENVTIKTENAPIETEDDPIKTEDDANAPEEKEEAKEDEAKEDTAMPMQPSPESIELGQITLEKQKILCNIANMLSQLAPIQETVELQFKNLNHVKSDITTDKTVCEVSGNFMSARDADERIAAHYAGKQYVGWKLVRDKLKEMIMTHGKYGPPRPPMRSGGAPPPRTGGGGGRGGWGRDQGPPGDFRGGNRDRRGPPRGRDGPPPGRWERGGGGNDRGFDNRRDRGGYDRGGGSRSGGYGRR